MKNIFKQKIKGVIIAVIFSPISFISAETTTQDLNENIAFKKMKIMNKNKGGTFNLLILGNGDNYSGDLQVSELPKRKRKN